MWPRSYCCVIAIDRDDRSSRLLLSMTSEGFSTSISCVWLGRFGDHQAAGGAATAAQR